MAQRAAPDGWDPPSVVQVTVEAGPRRARPVSRWTGLAAAAGVFGVAAVLGALFLDGGGGATRRHRPEPTASPMVLSGPPQLSAVTQAYRFPLGCLRITRTSEALTGALRRRTSPCWRYGVSVTAILRRIHGAWRLALETTGGACQRAAAPAGVTAPLTVCRALSGAGGISGLAPRRPPRPPAR